MRKRKANLWLRWCLLAMLSLQAQCVVAGLASYPALQCSGCEEGWRKCAISVDRGSGNLPGDDREGCGDDPERNAPTTGMARLGLADGFRRFRIEAQSLLRHRVDFA